MIAKTVEIRDRGTFIPALAVKLCPGTEADRYLLARAGYGTTPDQQADYVILMRLSGGTGYATSDPYEWPGGARDWLGGARTMPVAHAWLIENFDEIDAGAVVDVEFIAGETITPKRSEAELA